MWQIKQKNRPDDLEFSSKSMKQIIRTIFLNLSEAFLFWVTCGRALPVSLFAKHQFMTDYRREVFGIMSDHN